MTDEITSTNMTQLSEVWGKVSGATPGDTARLRGASPTSRGPVWLPLACRSRSADEESRRSLRGAPPLRSGSSLAAYVLPVITEPGPDEHQGLCACPACGLVSAASPGRRLWMMFVTKRAGGCRAVASAFSTIRRGCSLSGCAPGPLDHVYIIYASVDNVKRETAEVIHNRSAISGIASFVGPGYGASYLALIAEARR